MKESKTIDYNSKIANFMAMTETGDPDIATQYLTSANWDETLAVNNFFKRINSNINRNRNVINIPNNNNNNANNNNNNNDQGFFSSYILEPIKNLFSSCYHPREIDIEEENKIFQFLPNKVDDMNKFNTLIKKNIGIIILYNGNNIQFLNSLITQICRNSMLINLLKQNFIIYPLLSSTKDGFNIEKMTGRNLIYPAFIFCYNNSNNNTLTTNNIINILEGESITLNSFNNMLMNSLEKVNKNTNMLKKTESSEKYNLLSDAEVLDKQKKNMEDLERQIQMKEEQLKREKLEEEKKLKEIENKANEAKAKIVEEPSSDNPNCTTICFRYPDGEKRKDRRFLKTHTIQNLYDYVTSLGKEIYTEEENNSFSLYQPFPPKKYDNMEKTLEEEGLFPNAIIQIKEE